MPPNGHHPGDSGRTITLSPPAASPTASPVSREGRGLVPTVPRLSPGEQEGLWGGRASRPPAAAPGVGEGGAPG